MNWTWERIERLVRDSDPESLQLEFKAAPALSKQDHAKKEVTKDVSAMANSAGGTILYGIEESESVAFKLDPVDRMKFTKEWLEQVIDGIQPKLEGVQCYEVRSPSNPDGVIYVVEIPQSKTAHQARDMRYYKRYGTHAVPMSDYEIRDVMGRRSAPLLSVELLVTGPRFNPQTSSSEQHLYVFIRNAGQVLAQYVSGVVHLPGVFVAESEYERLGDNAWLAPLAFSIAISNIQDHIVMPLLPGTARLAAKIRLSDSFSVVCDNMRDATVEWVLYADNAPCRSGRQIISEITDNVATLNLFRT